MSGLKNFLLERPYVSYLQQINDRTCVEAAHQNQATYNAIHTAIIQWDQAALDKCHPGFSARRRKIVWYSIRSFDSAIFLMRQPSKDQPDYGRTDFVQEFDGYLLYRASTARGFIHVASIGVLPDARRLSYATRLILALGAMYPHGIHSCLVPESCLELCCLLKKGNATCKRLPADDCVHASDAHLFDFSWKFR